MLNKIFDEYWRFINRFITPQEFSSKILGIDVGTVSVKAVVLKKTGQGWGISHNANVPIISGDVKKALSQVLSSITIDEATVVASVSGKGTLIRYVDMPRMTMDELKKAFIYELDKYIPFEPNSVYTDCWILENDGKDKKMPVLIAASKKEIVDERIKLFHEAGIEIGQLTLNAIAIANAFEKLGPSVQEGKSAKAVLDVGGSVSNLLIIHNQVPRFTRDIFIGSNDFTKQIANTMGIDEAQAEALKCAPGDKADQIKIACESSLNHLASEVRLSLDYFITERNIQIDALYVTGGGAGFVDFAQDLSKVLSLPVELWYPVHSLQKISGITLPENPSAWSVALGLALADL